MLPESLSLICEELESQQGLQNLSFRKNVVRNNAKTYEFVDSMVKLLASAPALMHLDISEMFIGDEGISKIMIEGVAESKSMAGVHF